MKILSLELENVKRVSLVRMAPSANGLTVIGGNNAQGKSSVLDGIIYALGGEKYRPSNLQHEGGIANARIRIELSGGLIVERKGKNAALHVTDSTGRKHGQTLLNSFVEELALNLPKFLTMRDDEKAEVLLQTMGISDQLEALDLREKQAFDRRHDLAVIADQKKKFALEMKEYPDVPDTPISAAELIQQCQNILARNGEIRRLKEQRENMRNNLDLIEKRMQVLSSELESLAIQRGQLQGDLDMIAKTDEQEESTAELEAKIADIDNINAKIRANLDKAAAEADAEEYAAKVVPLTEALEAVRQEKRELLSGAKMPLPELTIGKNTKNRPVLLYRGQPWDGMSTMERFRVGTAIIKQLKPECGFILLDGLEAFDSEQMAAFDKWLQDEDLQAICTRVGSDDCTIIIEDGYAVQDGVEPAPVIPDMNDPIPMDFPEEKNNNNKEMEW